MGSFQSKEDVSAGSGDKTVTPMAIHKKVKMLQTDPRSPSVEISRTPIQIETTPDQENATSTRGFVRNKLYDGMTVNDGSFLQEPDFQDSKTDESSKRQAYDNTFLRPSN